MTDRGQTILDRVLGPAEPEILCDECFKTIDQYVDLELRGADAEAAISGLRPHLEGCPACAEEYASLRLLAGALSPKWA